ncbi:Tetratricopeptide repeat-containing protein [Enhydrobacter aerosaccus]|uniref:Tetratricopeptide repeat-containing protein n=1 Tax=Enhydrobacter aerosaccus TaxID=225324 RepID=A0A1T4R436_9HYPH|nr:tetratricopeptide repeat protein [Enhydrobacter aerosaccus]SKA10636.1 Tetratricopeptide repeat-containing protein [Enhydrobacter aerosaccus]
MFAFVRFLPYALALLVVGLWSPAGATDNPAMDTDLVAISEQWARIKYQGTDKSEQLRQIDQLVAQAAAVRKKYPGRAEPLLWEGIVTSEEAAMAHMLDQMRYARAARTLFEQAEAIDPNAANGGVLLSLGVIYYRVPGFPLGFGDDAKARKYLERAAALDPNGLDSAYFYGDFLIGQGEKQKAKAVLTHGLAAPVTPNRPIWDSGRRAEIQALIANIDGTRQ